MLAVIASSPTRIDPADERAGSAGSAHASVAQARPVGRAVLMPPGRSAAMRCAGRITKSLRDAAYAQKNWAVRGRPKFRRKRPRESIAARAGDRSPHGRMPLFLYVDKDPDSTAFFASKKLSAIKSNILAILFQIIDCHCCNAKNAWMPSIRPEMPLSGAAMSAIWSARVWPAGHAA